MRTDLCAEALRLGGMLASLTPHDTESLGLLALMELQASRLKARTGPDGEPVLLMDQDRTRWDHLLIRRGLAALERIDQLGGTAGPYALQDAIAASTVAPPPPMTPTGSAWPRSTTAWLRSSPSPVVELNRGVAVAQAFGPQAGLDIVLPLFDVAELRQYHLLPAVAGDLLCHTGEHGRARKHFLQAASLTSNIRERTTMQRRAAECAAQHGSERSK
jgi:RNA polymerase sigma-70 factor (ECF subfamily)